MINENSAKSEKVCTCQQILQNITKELDDYYAYAHNPEHSEGAQEFYAQQYQLLVGSFDRIGYNISRNSEGKHVVSFKKIDSASETTDYFSR